MKRSHLAQRVFYHHASVQHELKAPCAGHGRNSGASTGPWVRSQYECSPCAVRQAAAWWPINLVRRSRKIIVRAARRDGLVLRLVPAVWAEHAAAHVRVVVQTVTTRMCAGGEGGPCLFITYRHQNASADLGKPFQKGSASLTRNSPCCRGHTTAAYQNYTSACAA